LRVKRGGVPDESLRNFLGYPFSAYCKPSTIDYYYYLTDPASGLNPGSIQETQLVLSRLLMA